MEEVDVSGTVIREIGRLGCQQSRGILPISEFTVDLPHEVKIERVVLGGRVDSAPLKAARSARIGTLGEEENFVAMLGPAVRIDTKNARRRINRAR